MLENEVALVTGASRGIGQAIALALAAAGARVVGTATTRGGRGGSSTRRSRRTDASGRGAVLDVGGPGLHRRAARRPRTRQGEMPTILVNNAGITRDTLLLRMKDEDWDQVLDTNLSAVFRLSKACLKRMMKERHGRIINITSVIGVIGNAGQANYAAAKAGVIGFTKSLAREAGLAQHHRQRRGAGLHRHRHDARAARRAAQPRCWRRFRWAALARAEDVAAAVLFLASPQARLHHRARPCTSTAACTWPEHDALAYATEGRRRAAGAHHGQFRQ